MRIVGISGDLTARSRTRALVEFVVSQAATAWPHATDLIDVADLAPELAFTLAHGDAALELEAVLQKIENADLLVVGTPISKGSYTGLLKHLLDLLTGSRSEGAVAIIAATDTGDCNSLGLEHSLRPLLSLLGYCAAPTAVFARNDDFVGFHLAEESVIIRARRAVREAFRMLGLEPPLTTLIASDASLTQLDGVR
jgi:FMN reductase